MQQIITFQGLYKSYRDCRRHKRHTANAQRYDVALLDNLFESLTSLQNRSYSPSRSIRFISRKPKTREIHAADFSDRVIHHWLVPRLEKLFEPIFIHDVYSNRKGKGAHKAVDRLQSWMIALPQNSSSHYPSPPLVKGHCKSTTVGRISDSAIRQRTVKFSSLSDGVSYPTYKAISFATPSAKERVSYLPQDGNVRGNTVGQKNPGWYLQLDIANFFNSIDKRILFKLLQHRLRKGIAQKKLTIKEAETCRWLCHVLLRHDTARHARYRGDLSLLEQIPAHKLLGSAGVHKGLPIGNLTSQFFSNVYMNPLDQWIKHQLKCRCYLRYVDDFILLADSPECLIQWRGEIQHFLKYELQLSLKEVSEPRPIDSGANFLGYIVFPHYRLVRRRVVGSLLEKLQHYQRQVIRGGITQGYSLNLKQSIVQPLRSTLASYWGHFLHAQSYRLRKRILRQYPWLMILFEREALLGSLTNKRHSIVAIRPCWEPKACQLSGYQSQIRFFQKQYPRARLEIQRGTEQDSFKHTENLTSSESVKQSSSFQNLNLVVTHVFVREKGYYKGGLKRRHVFRLLIQPGVEICS